VRKDRAVALLKCSGAESDVPTRLSVAGCCTAGAGLLTIIPRKAAGSSDAREERKRREGVSEGRSLSLSNQSNTEMSGRQHEAWRGLAATAIYNASIRRCYYCCCCAPWGKADAAAQGGSRRGFMRRFPALLRPAPAVEPRRGWAARVPQRAVTARAHDHTPPGRSARGQSTSPGGLAHNLCALVQQHAHLGLVFCFVLHDLVNKCARTNVRLLTIRSGCVSKCDATQP